jgi:hypothetical protein
MRIDDLIRRINECESNIDYEKHQDGYYEKLVHSYPVLSMEEERNLFILYKLSKDKTFKDIIFKCHLRDVYDCCTDLTGYKMDLISEGNILLYEFIDNYDSTMPYTNFKQALTTRLTVLYKNMADENNSSLDTKMGTHELRSLEERGKNFTENIESNISEKEDIKNIKKYKLVIVKRPDPFDDEFIKY